MYSLVFSIVENVIKTSLCNGIALLVHRTWLLFNMYLLIMMVDL